MEMRLAALIQKPGHGPRAMRAQEVFDMATLSGAKALNWIDEIGSIEPGKKADLALFNLSAPENLSGDTLLDQKYGQVDPAAYVSALVYSTERHHLQWTMVDGKPVYKNGRLTAMSNQTLLSKVNQAHKTILAQAKKSVQK